MAPGPEGIPPEEEGNITVEDFGAEEHEAAQQGAQDGMKGKPQTQEEWDTFISSYSVGNTARYTFHSEDESDDPSPASRLSKESPSLERQSSTPLSNERQASSSSLEPPPRPLLHHNPSSLSHAVLLPSGSSQDPVDTSGSESRSDVAGKVTAAEAMNQDPAIPDIEDKYLPSISRSSSNAPSQASETSSKKGYRGQEAMTSNNMKRLGEEYRREEVKKASTEGSGKKAKRKIVEKATLENSSEGEGERNAAVEEASVRRKSTRRRPRPRGAWSSASHNGEMLRRDSKPSLDMSLFDDSTNTSTSISQADLAYDHAAERTRIKEFFEKNDFLCPPKQPPGAYRRRLRVIRRMGLEQPEGFHCDTLDKLSRLAKSFFRTQSVVISVFGRSRQIFLSKIGIDARSVDIDKSICCHTLTLSGNSEQCMVVKDAAKDWRFRKNPMVGEGRGPVRFYAGSPLKVGSDSKESIIGAICVFDTQPREFTRDHRALLADLASCVVSELELLYSQQASIESAKLHQISVDFLRRSLKHRPLEYAGQSNSGSTLSGSSGSMNVEGDPVNPTEVKSVPTPAPTPASAAAPDTGNSTGEEQDDSAEDSSPFSEESPPAAPLNSKKRIEGADANQSVDAVDIYDEACIEIRMALDAYAVAVVDLSQFHLFYPAYQSTTNGSNSIRTGSVTEVPGRKNKSGPSTKGGSTARQSSSSGHSQDDNEDGLGFDWSNKQRRARPTYSVNDAVQPARTPQVLFVPSRPTMRSKRYRPQQENDDSLSVLGYSCGSDGFAFNFTSSPAARKIIADFIASNVVSRKVWYARDDSQGIAQSITHLMPPGTETSMALPVFGFDGQVAFAVVACWKDPLYTYPSGALQFVETIAGSLLASVLKERLHKAERAQLNFASAASHELRTPLHQINAAASLLRSFVQPVFDSMRGDEDVHVPPEDRVEILQQLEIIESNGLSLGNILENIIDTLDIGKMASKMDTGGTIPSLVHKDTATGKEAAPQLTSLVEVLEKVVEDAIELESKSRKVSGGKGMDQVEVILEVLPRKRGGWLTTRDVGPLTRALGKIVHNAVKFTEKGHVHITVQDLSREVALPTGYDNSMRESTISIDVKDSGVGMSAAFLEKEVLQPFAKENPFTSGSGLGLGLAQRMVELVGGKLAIASSPGKGTLVHIEAPLFFLNGDSISDDENLNTNRTADQVMEPDYKIRQDGILLAGWENCKASVKRVAKSLVRQLKLHQCRLVTEAQYACVIVMPDGSLSDAQLAAMCRAARPGVQVIVLEKDRTKYGQGDANSPCLASSNPNGVTRAARLACPPRSPKGKEDAAFLATIPFLHLSRPLRPSILRAVMAPNDRPTTPPERYVSDVVGGEDARMGARMPVPVPVGTDIGQQAVGNDEPISPLENLCTPPMSRNNTSDPGDPPNDPLATPIPGSSREAPVRSQSLSVIDSRGSTDDEGSEDRPQYTASIISDMSASDSSEGVMSSIGSENKQVERRKRVEMDPSALKVVLVVEDNSVNRKILTTMLRRATCHFVEAVDGVEAVEQFSAFLPDLVLLDITMPKKDGFAAAAEMRQLETKWAGRLRKGCVIPGTTDEDLEEAMVSMDLEPQSQTSSAPRSAIHRTGSGRKRAKIIAVTAMSAEHQKRKGLYECGIDHWMTKPLSMGLLKSMVEDMKEEVKRGLQGVVAA
ncbi:hypothetical protein L198_05430 [Cryptococcus wingfieldii CBS 7118]|uniref:histidine kinase n=1 Tax=Cryptococcus wingfieldii CBS 7118 TaxID=1295528 RepID=A0A1E3IY80_9TREE|nr:hypothetical protein L198_05430 [Cryptococcus wingfieldii CBS 7118]ODN93564.1 hypothetical protein L198_05430 [Cryptococcus wingfieldii CBS 7118]